MSIVQKHKCRALLAVPLPYTSEMTKRDMQVTKKKQVLTYHETTDIDRRDLVNGTKIHHNLLLCKRKKQTKITMYFYNCKMI